MEWAIRKVDSAWLKKLLFAWVSGAAVEVRVRSAGKQQPVEMITLVNDDSGATQCVAHGDAVSRVESSRVFSIPLAHPR